MLMLSDARLYGACAVVLVYVASSVYLLWIAPRRRAGGRLDSLQADAVLVAFASQTGFAEQLAMRTAQLLASGGHPARAVPLAALDGAQLASAEQALFIVSTTGEGDAPDAAARFVQRELPRTLSLANLRYAVLALGDRQYANFCAFGHRLDDWLRHQGAVPMFDLIEVDNGEMGALRHWQHQLGVLTSNPDVPDWEAPTYERWQLTRRELLNAGSAGDPCFHIELRAKNAATTWTAGDILELDPRNSTWTREPALPHREYSIASIPNEGAVHLVVRQMWREDGSLGLGSGWLTQAPIGCEIAARIRPNSHFHVPEDDRPLVLIGNGTGIAGLLGLLKARIATGRYRNWLLFGERSQATDCFYGEQLDAWERTGRLARVDRVFSRDQAEKRYVQHRLAECAEELRSWVRDGAAIYVCGSLEGMAPAVHETLERVLGHTALESIAAEGRYRRDVY